MIRLGGKWDELLEEDFKSENYIKIRAFLKQEYANYTIYPSMYDIFNCFRFTPLDDLKAVILGQDPYHNAGQAMGLSFSVPEGVAVPPSLENIYKELQDDLGIPIRNSGDLTGWAKRGVLLLNTVLTVRSGMANSHAGCGWQEFTDGVIKKISDNKQHLVFMLWGANARSKKKLIDQSKHLILECAHPSPLSCYNGFFGCKHFSKANNYLKSCGKEEIDWDLN